MVCNTNIFPQTANCELKHHHSPTYLPTHLLPYAHLKPTQVILSDTTHREKQAKMAKPNTPSKERQRLQAQFARDERTIFTQIRAFFRAPATIDSLLVLNVMSKLFMVSAITFIWARTRPLGSVGRNILGEQPLVSFACGGSLKAKIRSSLTMLLYISLCLTLVGSVAFLTVSDIGITQFLWEFNDLQFVFPLSIL